MATKKPRAMITLEYEAHDVLKRLAEIQSTSVSKIVGELIHEVIPQLKAVLETIEQANAAIAKLEPEAKDRLREKLAIKEGEAIEAAREFKQALDQELQAGLGVITQAIEKESDARNDNA
jgi:hypothetical protein